MRIAVTAIVVLAWACGPRADGPTQPPVTAGGPPPRGADHRSQPGGRSVVIGELCPELAADRPAVVPWFARLVGWSDDPDDAAAPVGRGVARQFSVRAFDGRRAGLFTAVGLADLDGRKVAAGGYAGAPPCAKPQEIGQEPVLDPACVEIQRGCGLAIAEAPTTGAPAFEDPEPLRLDVGGACRSGDDLVVDVDRDGRVERFPIARFLDEQHGPADEVSARSGGTGECEPRFSLPRLLPEAHPRGFLGLDLLGVLDADADGRYELVLQLRYAGRRTTALYAAPASPGRLERVGEAIAP